MEKNNGNSSIQSFVYSVYKTLGEIFFSKLNLTQAEMEVKQKEEEIEKLQEALNKLINDAGVRTRQEVCIIYVQCCTN